MNKTDIKKLVQKAQVHCAENGERFTDSRRFVLEIIAASKIPIGAYDILAALGEKIENPKPPTAYRAIEFLQKQDFIHRIESLNAYVICHADHKHSGSQFMICDDCGKVIETHLCHLPKALEDRTKAEGFHMVRWNTELHGTCRACLA